MYDIEELDTRSKNRTFEFFLVNDKNSSTSNVNWSIDFGSEDAASNIPITLNSNVMVIVQNNYSNGGDHNFTVEAGSPGIRDQESDLLKFGVRAKRLDRIYSSGSEQLFEFEVKNDLDQQVNSVSWNCSDGISSLYVANLSNNQSLYDYISHNYTTPGIKTFACTASSPDGNETQSLTFKVKGLEVEKYDVLVKNASRQVLSFNAHNYFNDLSANISLFGDASVFSKQVNLTKDEQVMVFSEINYSSDGQKEASISLQSPLQNTSYVNDFTERGVSIENYQRTGDNSTTQVLLFDVKNNWDPGNVQWNVSDIGINQVTSLNTSEKLMVFVQNNYTQGDKQAVIQAQTSSFVDKITDFFSVRPLQLKSFQTLFESSSSAISEMVVKNTVGGNRRKTYKITIETESFKCE